MGQFSIEAETVVVSLKNLKWKCKMQRPKSL